MLYILCIHIRVYVSLFIYILERNEVDSPGNASFTIIICAVIVIALFLVVVLSVVIIFYVNLERKTSSEVYESDKIM